MKRFYEWLVKPVGLADWILLIVTTIIWLVIWGAKL